MLDLKVVDVFIVAVSLFRFVVIDGDDVNGDADAVDVSLTTGFVSGEEKEEEEEDVVGLKGSEDVTFGSNSGVACIFKSTSFVVKKYVKLLTDDDDDDDDDDDGGGGGGGSGDDDDRFGLLFVVGGCVVFAFKVVNVFISAVSLLSFVVIDCGDVDSDADAVDVSITTGFVSGEEKEEKDDVDVRGSEDVIEVVGSK